MWVCRGRSCSKSTARKGTVALLQALLVLFEKGVELLQLSGAKCFLLMSPVCRLSGAASNNFFNQLG